MSTTHSNWCLADHTTQFSCVDGACGACKSAWEAAKKDDRKIISQLKQEIKKLHKKPGDHHVRHHNHSDSQ